MADWNWRLQTPQFSHHVETRFDWGIIDLHMDVQQAVITDAVIFSDALNVELIDLLKETLVAYIIMEIKGALAELGKTQPNWWRRLMILKGGYWRDGGLGFLS